MATGNRREVQSEDFDLVDDGTLDTVLRCRVCGEIERFNIDEEALKLIMGIDRVSYCQGEAAIEHRCRDEAGNPYTGPGEVDVSWQADPVMGNEFQARIETAKKAERMQADLNRRDRVAAVFEQLRTFLKPDRTVDDEHYVIGLLESLAGPTPDSWVAGKPLGCYGCDMTFTDADELKNHEQRTGHGPDTNFGAADRFFAH